MAGIWISMCCICRRVISRIFQKKKKPRVDRKSFSVDGEGACRCPNCGSRLNKFGLSLCTDSELFNEIGDRADWAVLVMVRKTSPGNYRTVIARRGHPHMCVGAALQAADMIRTGNIEADKENTNG